MKPLVALWDLPASEWDAYVAAGFAGAGDDHRAYQARIDAAVAAALTDGHQVIRVRATVEHVVRVMGERRLPAGPAGRAEAIAWLARRSRSLEADWGQPLD